MILTISPTGKASRLAIETAAQVWCRTDCANKPMDPVLAMAFAEVLHEVWSQAWLGNATTGELLNEIRARVDCSYSTTGGEIPESPQINPAWLALENKYHLTPAICAEAAASLFSLPACSVVLLEAPVRGIPDAGGENQPQP